LSNKKQDKESAIKIVADNRKARFDYHILESFEAGMVLSGEEIKSIRTNGITLTGSYVRADADAIWLIGAHIKTYSFSQNLNYNPTRVRKLLLKQSEINKLRGKSEQKGLTIVPLKLYLKRGLAKLEIALAKGKNAPDKRETIKRREGNREMARALSS
jgi:SsrA-binding protein